MVNDVEIFLEEYLDEKLEVLCEEFLAGKMEKACDIDYLSYGISFNNIFEELTFVILYEEKSYEVFRKNLFKRVYDILKELPDEEITLLLFALLKAEIFYVEDTDLNEEIAVAIIKLANTKVLNHLYNISTKIYEKYMQQLKEGIMEFRFSGSVAGDYETSDYWEEFCLITQENYDYLYDICYEDIYSYILDVLNKSPEIDIKLLFAGIEDITVEGIENPLSIHAEMNNCIAEKLFDLISDMAASEDIMHILYTDDYDE
ncbi:hypothetical protein [Metabacillus sp. RGM 3146]|uniref:hypothetical protein n=1 Tax=Metabacillus sp. RGM 3146 TaxID=3401092 RepID=UPI003B9BA649